MGVMKSGISAAVRQATIKRGGGRGPDRAVETSILFHIFSGGRLGPVRERAIAIVTTIAPARVKENGDAISKGPPVSVLIASPCLSCRGLSRTGPVGLMRIRRVSGT